MVRFTSLISSLSSQLSVFVGFLLSDISSVVFSHRFFLLFFSVIDFLFSSMVDSL